jgi:alpha-D-ribose 1-methylphosphonate 5-triphosphate synthase subunit PhnI
MSRSKVARPPSPIRWTAAGRQAARRPRPPELSLDQIDQQLGLAVDRVMTEGSCYDRSLAALAIKQARGDLIEAIFLLRAYRTTLPRFGYTLSRSTPARMVAERRISARRSRTCRAARSWARPTTTPIACSTSRWPPSRDRPGRPTAPAEPLHAPAARRRHPGARRPARTPMPCPKKIGERPDDLTRQPLACQPTAPLRLQNLARGDEGFLLALGYSTQRGYGNNHPFVGEIRYGHVPVSFVPEELGFAIEIGEIDVTECDMVNQFAGSHDGPPQFTRGYGLAFGHAERKAIAMALVDRALRARELAESAPTRPLRTKNSCWPIPTMSRLRDSYST